MALKGSFKIKDLIFVKELAQGEHVPGFIEFVPEEMPITWPPVEDLPMMFVIKNGDGSYAIRDLTSGNASNRVCPAPAGFGPDDMKFITVVDGGREIKIDWAAKARDSKLKSIEYEKAQANRRWNEMSIWGRIKNAVRPT